MTGRELIVYILENHLEDRPICDGGKLVGFLTLEEAAVKFEIGPKTMEIIYRRGDIDGIDINGTIYILANAKPGNIRGDKC